MTIDTKIPLPNMYTVVHKNGAALLRRDAMQTGIATSVSPSVTLRYYSHIGWNLEYLVLLK